MNIFTAHQDLFNVLVMTPAPVNVNNDPGSRDEEENNLPVIENMPAVMQAESSSDEDDAPPNSEMGYQLLSQDAIHGLAGPDAEHSSSDESESITTSEGDTSYDKTKVTLSVIVYFYFVTDLIDIIIFRHLVVITCRGVFNICNLQLM